MDAEAKSAASEVLTAAVRHLHSGQVPDNMPCRMREHLQLKRHIGGMLQRRAGGAVYVAGSPGTGKTASVVSRLLKARLAKALNEDPFHRADNN